MGNLYSEVMSHDIIYSLMYSPTRDDWRPLDEQIIQIETSKLQWSKDKNEFFYIWGYPGPDYNAYSERTYGKGWAFTRHEIVKAWGESK